MAYNGDGTFSFPYSWTLDAANGIPITASRMDTQFANATSGFDLCITRDGQGVATALIPFPDGISIGGGDSLTTLQSGTFTPTDASGAGLSLTVNRAVYTQIGTRVWVELTFSFPVTADSNVVSIELGTLPTCANVAGVSGMWSVYFGGSVFLQGFMTQNTNTFSIYDATGSAQHNSGLSNSTLRMQFNYATV